MKIVIIFNTIVDSEKEKSWNEAYKQTKIDTTKKMKHENIDINTISKIIKN